MAAIVPAPVVGPPREKAIAASLKPKSIADAILSSPASLQWTYYSTAKLLALHEYCETTSYWRVAAVLLLTPVPAFVASILPSFIHLANPLKGADANYAVAFHCFIAIFNVSFGTIILVLGGTMTPRSEYSMGKAVWIALATTAVVTACGIFLSYSWRFPVPFFDLTLVPVWLVMMWVLHRVLMRHEFARNPTLAKKLYDYRKPLLLQSAQFSIYAGLTIVFDWVPMLFKLAMVVLFPLVKFALKRLLRKVTHQLEEMSAEVVVSTIEICASLYQAMIMQTTPSSLALVAIMAVDAIQAFLSIKLFMGRNMVTLHAEVFGKAVAILKRCRLERRDSRKFSAFRATLPAEEAVIVTEALQLASAVDRVVMVEYFEVSVPVVNALFLLATYRSTSTLYNTRLNQFYDQPELVLDATKSVLVYSLVQALSLVVFLLSCDAATTCQRSVSSHSCWSITFGRSRASWLCSSPSSSTSRCSIMVRTLFLAV